MAEGRVTVNGQTVRELGAKADPEADDIRVDGRPIRRASATRRLPARSTSRAATSPRGRTPRAARRSSTSCPACASTSTPSGRLDYDSEGLLILTNDGDLAARAHAPQPRGGARVPRAGPRRARQSRARPPRPRRRARRPPHGPADVRLVATNVGQRGDQSLVSIVLHEGRTRQVRRMCETVGHPVVRLRRVRIGPLTDPVLKTGMVRELTAREVAALPQGRQSRVESRESSSRSRQSAVEVGSRASVDAVIESTTARRLARLSTARRLSTADSRLSTRTSPPRTGPARSPPSSWPAGPPRRG